MSIDHSNFKQSAFCNQLKIKEIGYDLGNINPILSVLIKNWAELKKPRRSYNKLTASIIKNYVYSKLQRIRRFGVGEANKIVNELILSKKNEYDAAILEMIESRKDSMCRFLCQTAMSFDIEALSLFLVNLIYGGITSSRIHGNFLGIIDLNSTDTGKISEKSVDFNEKRTFLACSAIDSLKNRGVGAFIIQGNDSDVFSSEMVAKYRSSPEYSFIIIETPGVKKSSEKLGENMWNGKNESGTNTDSLKGKSAYREGLLAEISKLKNVLVLISARSSYFCLENYEKYSQQNDDSKPYGAELNSVADFRVEERSNFKNSEWFYAKLRALESYKILHGTITDRKSKTNGIQSLGGIAMFSEIFLLTDLIDKQTADKATEILAAGKSLDGLKYDNLAAKMSEKMISEWLSFAFSKLPNEAKEFIDQKTLPIILPNIRDFIGILSYFVRMDGKNDVFLVQV
jgi:hypothetical protein